MTRYLSAWASVYAQEATDSGNTVHSLVDQNANQSRLQGMIAKLKPNIVFLNGHGSETFVMGHDNQIIIDMDTANILEGTTVYALACRSTRQLGTKAKTLGAKGYIGYSEDFILVSQPRKIGHPTEDKTAALFLGPSNQIIRAITKGHSAGEAVRKGKKAFSDSISEALNSDVQSDDDKFIPYLFWNSRFLTAC